MKELHPWDVYLSKRAHDIPWPAFFEAKFRRCTDKEVRFFFCERNVGHQLQGILHCEMERLYTLDLLHTSKI